MVDYSFHQIITDASDDVIFREVPEVVASGVRSLKVFLTYDPLHLDDRQFLRVLAAARRTGALVTVHCENYEAICWRIAALLADGRIGPKYHAWSRPSMVEREAAHRAIALAEMVDQPIQIFHVSCPEVAEEIERAQRRGVKVWGETCPQFSFCRRRTWTGPGSRARSSCAARRRAMRRRAKGCGRRYARHAGRDSGSQPYGYDSPRGKRAHGDNAPFNDIPNGVPGLGSRLPIVFSEGVSKGRIDACEFVRLTASNPARLFGLHPRKGTIAPGADADLVVWDAEKRVTITNDLLQHVIDYTPYDGLEVTGWPVATVRRGEIVMRDGKVQAEPGSGQFLAREPYAMIRPTGRLPDGFDASAFLV